MPENTNFLYSESFEPSIQTMMEYIVSYSLPIDKKLPINVKLHKKVRRDM